MYEVLSTEKNNISNLLIKTDFERDFTLFNFKVTYIDETILNLQTTILEGVFLKLFLINKENESEQFHITISDKEFEKRLVMPFKLKFDDSPNFSRIPRIIHQSYKKYVKKKMYNAITSWKLMNINFDYKYWDDDECYSFIKNNFNQDIFDAYNSLYAGAYKSDIFRLCVLYYYGGVWTDISSACECPLERVIEENINLVIVKDHPSQIKRGNIYQAFIISDKNNEIIKYILDFTVNKVLNYEEFDRNNPDLTIGSLSVTGPTIFAAALNTFLNRQNNQIINDIYINYNNDNLIRLIDHFPGEIKMNNNVIINTKYNNWLDERTSVHYSTFFENGFIYKKKLIDITRDETFPCIYQIWIQNEYVSKNMYNAVQEIIQNNKDFNYKLLTNDKIIELIKDEQEFPLLLKTYNRLIPYAYKSDLIRYYILYKYGGVYIDIDFVSIYGIKELYDNFDIVLCKDLDSYKMYNAFICTKKGNLFFKFVIENIMNNIENNKQDYEGDLDITGPKLLARCFKKYFNMPNQNEPFFEGNYNLNNNIIKILNHSNNLPIPDGCWKDSSKNYHVHRNILHAECQTTDRRWNKTHVFFYNHDKIYNANGILAVLSGEKRTNNYDKDSTFIFDESKLYFYTKYFDYNYEKIKFLEGNDFATMYNNNNVIKNN
jgi:mannosyltransferase OCH1-like enzyme